MKKIIFFSTVVGLVSMLLLLFGVISMEPNPITLNYKIPLKKKIYRLAPQGWIFFTKNVHEDYFKIYYKNDDNKYELVSIKSSSKNQLFGIKRTNRSIMHKINYIISNIDENLWYTYKGNVNKINNDSLSKVSISALEPMLYGEFLIAKGKPLPYEWSKSNLEIFPKMAYITLNIKNE